MIDECICEFPPIHNISTYSEKDMKTAVPMIRTMATLAKREGADVQATIIKHHLVGRPALRSSFLCWSCGGYYWQVCTEVTSHILTQAFLQSLYAWK